MVHRSESPIFVVAVSGGVDSVALLDMIVHNYLPGFENAKIIVAHFDHGIRADSKKDELFVKTLTQKYGLRYESMRIALGAETSELHARQERYKFLRQICKKHNAQLVTAHHQDDLIETAIINLIRGTNWRGLTSLRSDNQTLRPLLGQSKQQLVAYAKEHQLSWHEDSTNTNQAYLRNYVRLTLLPVLLHKEPQFKTTLLHYIQAIQRLQPDIDHELNRIVSADSQQSRYSMIMWPAEVSQEVVYRQLVRLDPAWHPSKAHITQALHFIKTGAPHKQMIISKRLRINLTSHAVQFKKA